MGMACSRSFASRQAEEGGERRHLANSETDLESVGKHGLVILRDKSLYAPGPDQHGGRAADQGEQVVRDGAETLGAGLVAAPADESRSEHESGLAADQHGGNFDGA